ncbi:MAG TPA: right-handed parallel beta-helix repeat-containing protein, partial [bacterium]|nr:right-handed parallel beta-helix repeat-containing protein [bacterium]
MKVWLTLWLMLTGSPGLWPPLLAKDIYVDNINGKDAYNGFSQEVAPGGAGPLASIDKALRLAGPGDTVHLVPTGQPYRQTADFYGVKGGQPGKPLVLDGHGATLTGAEECSPEGWKQWRDDVVMRDDLISHVFLLVNDRMVFATRNVDCLKPGEVCFSPEELNRLHFWPPPGKKAEDCVVEAGWSDGRSVKLDGKGWKRASSSNPALMRYEGLQEPAWVKVDGVSVSLVRAKERLSPGQWCSEGNTMYYRPPAGQSLSTLKIAAIVRQNGVQMAGETAHVVVRNLNVRHVYNDGYNIHGHVTRAEFYNCHAFQCGDEGFSAHDACETLLDGAIYEYCDNGIANVNQQGFSITRNVILSNSRCVGFLIQGQARHELTGAILINNPTQIVAVNTRGEDLLIVNTADSPVRNSSAVRCSGESSFVRMTTAGNSSLFFVAPDSRLTLNDSLLTESQAVFHCRLEEPLTALKMKNVRVGEGVMMEWSSTYPWKKMTLKDWFKEAEKKGAAENCGLVEKDLAGCLMQGIIPEKLPADAGCSTQLLEKYVRYRQS